MDHNKDLILSELEMLTGKTSPDISYLYYLLIKDGNCFKEDKEETVDVSTEDTVDSFEDWFNNL